MLMVPQVMRAKALNAGAEDWLDNLADVIADLEQEWAMRVGQCYADSTEAYVAEAALGGGTPAVLKLVVPRAEAAALNEITALRLADGQGCARLLRSDVGCGALLLERLGRSLFELQVPVKRRHAILCSVARQGVASCTTRLRVADRRGQGSLVDDVHHHCLGCP
jgi:streptomycin 6-kinase